jgi:hypothetical protein
MQGDNLGSGTVNSVNVYGTQVAGSLQLECIDNNPPTAPFGSGYDQQTCPNGTEQYEPFTLDCTTLSAGNGNDNGTPIIIDVDGSGFHLDSADQGVLFDFFGDGSPLQMSWTAVGSTNGFLVRDLSGTGKITSGKEMFGNLTQQPASKNPNGFAALAQYDDNGDGWIDPQDVIWGKLLLWQDTNHNGITDEGELHSLDEMGIKRISVRYHEDRKVDEYGNLFRYEAAINDSSTDHRVYDVILEYKKPAATN